MNCDIDYRAWCVLDALQPTPEIEERKQRIIHRTLARVEQATHESQVDEMAEIQRLESEYGSLLPWLDEHSEAAGPCGLAGKRDARSE